MLDDREQLEAPSRRESDAAVQGQTGPAAGAGGAAAIRAASAAKPAPALAPARRSPAWPAFWRWAPEAYYGHYWWTTGRYVVATDDAYVGRQERDAVAQGLRLYLGRCRRG